MNYRSYKVECLDFLEAVQRSQVYPVMYCYVEVTGKFDLSKLKEAVRISGKVIPELFCSYDFRHHRFVSQGFTVEDIIYIADTDFETLPIWDLERQPQLKIMAYCGEKRTKLGFGMSHVLSDGAGFWQYLYLLASLYNGESFAYTLKNERRISGFLKNVRIQRRTEQTRYTKAEPAGELRPCKMGTEYCFLKHTIPSRDFKKLHRKASTYRVTLNDVFMTAYARVISRMQEKANVSLPCPADLRSFWGLGDEILTVANMTGLYRNVVIECDLRHDFTAAVLKVHIEMTLQKSRCRCLEGIHLLACAYPVIPHCILEKMVRAAYQPLPVSYTNIGAIEHEKLTFHDCETQDCVITGTYRYPPDFQLTISTFRDVCTLNCTLVGDAEAKAIAGEILDRVVRELLEWISISND